MKNAVEIKSLKKTYKSKFSKEEKNALKEINLTIEKGSFFGLLGPNGAGKSTLINIIAGLVNKTSGSVNVCGYELDTHPLDIRSSIGVVPQEVMVDPFFSVYETLEIYAGYFGVPKKKRRTEEILEALHLYDKKDVSPRRLSGGMKRRLLIAKALVHNPEILILDEPTAGVDVDLRLQLWNYVKELNKSGTTILLTTHYLEEAEELCDKISIINNGEIVANDSTKNLLKNLGSKSIVLTISKKIKKLPDSLKKLNIELLETGNELKVIQKLSNLSINELLNTICAEGYEIIDISTEETDLEDVFRRLVKN